jgi:hypothetical protein
MKMGLLPRNAARLHHRVVTIPVVTDEDERRGREPHDLSLELTGIQRGGMDDGAQVITLKTNTGNIAGRFHALESTRRHSARAVIWVGGAGGGFNGPALGLYPAACERLQRQDIAGLRIHCRRPNELADCILDTLVAAAFLAGEGFDRIGLVGHSFGGAVVISAAALSSDITAVVPLSTQTYGADLAPQVSPRPMLLIHGTADRILPPECSEIVYAAAREPKELVLCEGADHGLDAARAEVLDRVVAWLKQNV